MLGFGMMNSIISGHLAGSYASSPDPLRFYSGAINETIGRDLRSRARARSRIIDAAPDRTIDDLLVIADKVLAKVEPERFFDPDMRKRALISSIPTLIRNGGARKTRGLLLPLINANYSFA
jgi:hypothetical protein